MPTQDYYKILGVAPESGPGDIRDSYRKLAFLYHPDRNRGAAGASEKMKQLNEAYAVLSDPEKRRRYDLLRGQYGPSAHAQFRKAYSEQDIFRGSDIHNIFEQMARAHGISGFEKVFRQFYGQEMGPFQHRSGGSTFRGFVFKMPSGAGKTKQPSVFNGAAGRLLRYLLERIGHLEIPQDGEDITDTIRISPELAKKGGPYAYYHRWLSKKLVVQIPAAVRENQRIRLAGLGHAGKSGGRNGDLFLKVRIRKPFLKRLKQLLTG